MLESFCRVQLIIWLSIRIILSDKDYYVKTKQALELAIYHSVEILLKHDNVRFTIKELWPLLLPIRFLSPHSLPVRNVRNYFGQNFMTGMPSLKLVKRSRQSLIRT